MVIVAILTPVTEISPQLGVKRGPGGGGVCVDAWSVELCLGSGRLRRRPHRQYINIFSTALRCLDGEAPSEHRFTRRSVCARVGLHGRSRFSAAVGADGGAP